MSKQHLPKIRRKMSTAALLHDTSSSVLNLPSLIGNKAMQAALLQRDEPDGGTSAAPVGPTINVENGTTEELRAELQRLNEEYRRTTDHNLRLQYLDTIHKIQSRIAERGSSSLPDSTVVLEFDGSQLQATGSISKSYPAVSGRPDSAGNFDYSPARQHQESVGPIPEGTYWLDPEQLKNLWYYVGDAADAWGSHRLTIHPFDSTHTFGRGGFFIHGGSTAGSAGCIDLTSNMANFVQEVLQHPHCQYCKILLRVTYPIRGDFPQPNQEVQVG